MARAARRRLEVLGGDDSRLPLMRAEVEAVERRLGTHGKEVPADLVDADLHHVAATLYAAMALLRGSTEAAAAAGGRGTEAGDALAAAQLPDLETLIAELRRSWTGRCGWRATRSSRPRSRGSESTSPCWRSAASTPDVVTALRAG